jgi:hypothetical protein
VIVSLEIWYRIAVLLHTLCCDNLPLSHSYTCMIHPGIFRPPRVEDRQFFICNIPSTLFKMLCDIMSTLLWGKMWTVCHMLPGSCGGVWVWLAWGGQNVTVILNLSIIFLYKIWQCTLILYRAQILKDFQLTAGLKVCFQGFQISPEIFSI